MSCPSGSGKQCGDEQTDRKKLNGHPMRIALRVTFAPLSIYLRDTACECVQLRGFAPSVEVFHVGLSRVENLRSPETVCQSSGPFA